MDRIETRARAYYELVGTLRGLAVDGTVPGTLSYEDRGQIFVVRLVNDLDRDGHEATWILTLRVANNSLISSITPPRRGVY